MLPQEDGTGDTEEPSTVFVLYAPCWFVDETDEALSTIGCETASFLLDWIRRITTDRATSITDTFSRWFLHHR